MLCAFDIFIFIYLCYNLAFINFLFLLLYFIFYFKPMSFPLLDWTGFMLGLEISSDWCEVHVNVIKWASADFGGGMLNCSKLLVSWKWFYPPQHPPVYPRFHAPFAQGLHFNLPICCNCFESWLARHILFKPPPNLTHVHMCVCVCVCVCPLVDVSNTISDAHERSLHRTSAENTVDVRCLTQALSVHQSADITTLSSHCRSFPPEYEKYNNSAAQISVTTSSAWPFFFLVAFHDCRRGSEATWTWLK